MKKYNIVVDGNAYEVEISEIDESKQSKKVNEESHQELSQQKPKTNTATEKVENIKAPLSGTVLSVEVSEGDNVSAGDILLVVEAMKMETEIRASRSGRVESINTSKGAEVEPGDTLITLE